RPRRRRLFPYTTLFRSLDDAADAGGLLEQQNGDAQLSQPVRARQPGDAATDHNGLRGSMHGVRAFAAGLLKGIGTEQRAGLQLQDRKSTRLNSSHGSIS